MLRTRKNALFPTSVCCWLIVLESCRITPPRACGKNLSTLLLLSQGFGSPRACGENIRAGNRQTLRYGSPPHMRGKLEMISDNVKIKRITPAHAGKTPFRNIQNRGLSDHPRTCGENFVIEPIIAPTVGSPPHMRGKHFTQIIVEGS